MFSTSRTLFLCPVHIALFRVACASITFAGRVKVPSHLRQETVLFIFFI